MIGRNDLGLLLGLGIILGFFSTLVSLVSVLIIQPFDIQLVFRRQWMHWISVEFLFGSIAFFGLCSVAFWFMAKAKTERSSQHAAGGRASAASSDRAGPTVPSVGQVWVCPLNASPLNNHLVAEGDEAAVLNILKRYQAGEDIAPSEFPRSFILRGKLVPRDVMVSGFVFVSDTVASILARFELGRNVLVPLEGIYRGRAREKLETGYNLLTLVNRKRAFSPDDSAPAAIKQWAEGIPMWHLYLDDSPQGAIAVTDAALHGAELWIDPAAPFYLFVSDRLKAALDRQGIGLKMGFTPCHVVPADQV